MGSIVREKQEKQRKIYINVVGTDRLKQVEVIKNNEQFMSWEEDKSSCEHLVKDNSDSTKTDFYYLRIVQDNGQMAWSSPIWFEAGQSEPSRP
jgi:hypothetical protein